MAIGLEGKGPSTALSEINVTPFVDVMLVLLVIFMLVAPHLKHGMDVKLPRVEAAPMMVGEEEIIITVTGDGRVYIGGNEVAIGSLGDTLVKIAGEKKKDEVYLRADQDVRYGVVAGVMAQVKNAGIEGLGIITEAPSKTKGKEKRGRR